jgi:ABC-2 type transport system ATP-binding protein
MTILSLDRVTKAFGNRKVLTDLTFAVGEGEIFGMLGPNGAGKSTTFNIICNLLLPDQGQVQLAGTTAASAPRGALGVVAQNISLYKNLSARENLAFFGSLYGLSGAALAKRVDTCLADINLGDRRNSLARDLSGGMQRRLHLGIALMHEPKLLILDEPSAGLDVEARRDLWALLRRLQQAGLAILLTTHLLDEAEALCARIGVLQAGTLVAVGTPEALRARVRAVEIACLQSPAPKEVVARAAKHRLTTRQQAGGIAVWLSQRLELREILTLFEGVPVTSLARRPVTLEDAYVEIMAGADGASLPIDALNTGA